MTDDAPRVLPGFEMVKRATQGNSRDIVLLRNEVAELKRRIAELEARRRPGRPRKSEAA